MDRHRFIAADLAERLACLRVEGEYCGSRIHGGHQVHLYRMEGFYCEMWMRIGLRYVEFIEVVDDLERLVDHVRLPAD